MALYLYVVPCGMYNVALLYTYWTKQFSGIVQTFVILEIMVSRLLQPEKAYSPIDITLLPIVKVVSPVQSEKADFPIDVMPLGIVNEVRPEQPEKA